MKRVYVVFEDRYAEDPWGTHERKFIDVYDNLQAAEESIHTWAESQQNVMSRKTEKLKEDLAILNRADPYANDSRIIVKHYIESTLLKSS